MTDDKKKGFAQIVSEWWQTDQNLHVLTFFCLFELAFGFVALVYQVPVEKGTAILWGAGCFWVGMLGGFVFAIPKVAVSNPRTQDSEPATPVQRTVQDEKLADQIRSRHRVSDVNTNLGEISDWLTKTIVGVGMVELTKVPSLLHRLGTYIAGGIPSVPNGNSLALALVCYFSVFGFVNGYLYTRMFAAPAFRRVDELSNREASVH